MQYLGENLIFLISLPRSGSTMLQRVLAAHSDIFTVAEPWLMLHPIYALRQSGIHTEYDASLAHLGLSEYLHTVDGGEDLVFSAIRSYARVLYEGGLKGRPESCFLDKTPRYYLIARELRSLFPEARMVMLKRNPLAVLASILHTWVKNDLQKLLIYKTDLMRGIDCMLSAGSSDENVTWISYEKTVSFPEREIPNLAARLGLAYEPAMIDYGQFSPPTGTMGDPVNARKTNRPTTQFLNKWQDILLDSPVYWYFANFYLKFLGRQRVEEWGYSYNSLRKALSSKPISISPEERKISALLIQSLSS